MVLIKRVAVQWKNYITIMKNIKIIPILSFIDFVVVILCLVLFSYNPQNILSTAMAFFALFVNVLLFIMIIRELARDCRTWI